MKTTSLSLKEHIYQLLETVPDPEVPVISVIDLVIVRDVIVTDNIIEIVITPTYTGCPAMDMIETNIKAVLQDNGFNNVKIKSILSPAWTTDWLSESGKNKLRAYGIAPPVGRSTDKSVLTGEAKLVCCPQCGSDNTEMISQFGSTACKSLFKCLDCKEPFDYFKCH